MPTASRVPKRMQGEILKSIAENAIDAEYLFSALANGVYLRVTSWVLCSVGGRFDATESSTRIRAWRTVSYWQVQSALKCAVPLLILTVSTLLKHSPASSGWVSLFSFSS